MLEARTAIRPISPLMLVAADLEAAENTVRGDAGLAALRDSQRSGKIKALADIESMHQRTAMNCGQLGSLSGQTDGTPHVSGSDRGFAEDDGSKVKVGPAGRDLLAADLDVGGIHTLPIDMH